MIVVDASAVLEILLNTSAAPRIAEHVFAPAETLHAPHLLDLEVAQVLRRYEAAGELDAARGVEALEDLVALGDDAPDFFFELTLDTDQPFLKWVA